MPYGLFSLHLFVLGSLEEVKVGLAGGGGLDSGDLAAAKAASSPAGEAGSMSAELIDDSRGKETKSTPKVSQFMLRGEAISIFRWGNVSSAESQAKACPESKRQHKCRSLCGEPCREEPVGVIYKNP